MITAWNGYPHSVSILRDTGIERIVTYHPTEQPTPNMTYIDEFIETPCNGIYLKWLNKKSGYDYWLFNPKHEQYLVTEDLGRILSTDTNRARAISATHSIGKSATIEIKATTKIPNHLKSILEYVLVSPEVYLFNPDSLTSSVSCSEFVKVFVDPGTFLVQKHTWNSVKLSFKFSLDQKNVQTIV